MGSDNRARDGNLLILKNQTFSNPCNYQETNNPKANFARI